MIELKKCTVVSCDRPVQPSLYDGQPYCGDHYMEKLHGDFEAEYSNWMPVAQPFGKMRSLMGRMLEAVSAISLQLSSYKERISACV